MYKPQNANQQAKQKKTTKMHLKQHTSSSLTHRICHLILIHITTCLFAHSSASSSPAGGNLFFKAAPPEIVAVPLGGSLELECEAAGSPSPTMHWLFNGQRLVQVSVLFSFFIKYEDLYIFIYIYHNQWFGKQCRYE